MNTRLPLLALLPLLAFSSASRGAEPLLLQWGAIDTSAAAPAKSARNVMQKGADAGRAAFLVQFEGAITEQWRTWLEGATQVRGYIPANAYLVWATAAEMDAIAAHEGVY